MGRSLRLYLWNRYALAEGTITSSGELDGDNYPVEDTQNLAVGDTWRSSGVAGDTYIIRDLGDTYIIGGVGIVARNLTRSAQVRVRIGNTSNFATNLYDSGQVNFHLPIYTSAERTATTLNPTSYISEFFDSNGLPTTHTIDNILKLPVRTFELPAEITARYIRIDFFDSTNPDGYVEISHVYAGRILEPSPDILYGYRISRQHTARQPQSASGQYWCANVYKRVRLSCTLAPQRETDMLGYWYLLELLVGLNQPLIVSVEDSNNSIKFYTAFFGILVQNPQNTNVAFKRHSFSFDVEENVSVAS